MLTNAAIIVSTSGESMTQERKTAQSKNNAYIMRVLVDCFTAGRQEQHKLHVSEQQQHATYTTHTQHTHSLLLLTQTTYVMPSHVMANRSGMPPPEQGHKVAGMHACTKGQKIR